MPSRIAIEPLRQIKKGTLRIGQPDNCCSGQTRFRILYDEHPGSFLNRISQISMSVLAAALKGHEKIAVLDLPRIRGKAFDLDIRVPVVLEDLLSVQQVIEPHALFSSAPPSQLTRRSEGNGEGSSLS